MDGLDSELKIKAREALSRADFNPDHATELLIRWIQAGYVGVGLAERLMADYIGAIISEERRALDT